MAAVSTCCSNGYDVRCCRLSPAFMEALHSQHQGVHALSLDPSHFSSGPDGQPIAPQQIMACMDEHRQQVESWLQAMGCYTGITPLWARPPSSSQEWGAGSGDIPTKDGFGAADNMAGLPGMSWVEVLAHIGAKPNDFITVIIMQHANFGTLWTAIKVSAVRGLEHLHACNVVHGDIKPVWAMRDFGLSKLVVGSKHISKNASGTTNYMAPELFLDREVSHRTDVYAFGIMLWQNEKA
ncbi:protein kinase domain-containing protein [Haematococcus lacustris]|uniref:Protein kinase domain-containing protein n=1 Tax=Haematococcus lacustris TaxID=44745 RepID=A0A699YN44_HAELA|nr:protein kinase domain-containing protein [Haematococcus lacustris]